MFTFRIDVKEEKFFLYLAVCCSYLVFKKIKFYSYKSLIPGRDHVLEIPEMNHNFLEINRGSLLYTIDTTRNFV